MTANAYAESDKLSLINYQPEKKSKYQRPEDLLEWVPILNRLRLIRFDRYVVKLNTNRVDFNYSKGRRITGTYSLDAVYEQNVLSASFPMGYANTMSLDRWVLEWPSSYVVSVAPFNHNASRVFIKISMRV